MGTRSWAPFVTVAQTDALTAAGMQSCCNPNASLRCSVCGWRVPEELVIRLSLTMQAELQAIACLLRSNATSDIDDAERHHHPCGAVFDERTVDGQRHVCRLLGADGNTFKALERRGLVTTTANFYGPTLARPTELGFAIAERLGCYHDDCPLRPRAPELS